MAERLYDNQTDSNDDWASAGNSYIRSSGNSVFDKLRKKAKDVADRLVLEEAKKTKFILSHRMSMGAEDAGRYPRYKGTDAAGNDLSKKSYQQWHIKPTQNGNIVLYNSATGYGDFPYPILLLHGINNKHGYFWGTRRAGVPKRLPTKNINVKGFSTQMPNGIAPFLSYRRQALIKAFKKEL